MHTPFFISKRSKLNVRDDERNSYIIAPITKELFRTTLKMPSPHLLLSGPWSTDVRVCAFAEESCPGHADDSCPGEKPSSSSSYCACGYIGPLCSQCARTHFADWARGVCADCDEAESHAPFIGLVVGLVICAIAIAAVLYSKRESIQQSACFKSAEQLIWVGSVKASLLFFMAQTMSEFSIISAANGDEGEYPQPASGFASILGASNLDFLRVMPTGCMFPFLTFYHRLVIKTLLPMVVVALMWCYPLYYRLFFGSAYNTDNAVRSSIEYTLVFLELVLPTVSSTIATVFVCDSFDEGHYLREQLTLACDDSQARAYWCLYSGLMALIYPIGASYL